MLWARLLSLGPEVKGSCFIIIWITSSRGSEVVLVQALCVSDFVLQRVNSKSYTSTITAPSSEAILLLHVQVFNQATVCLRRCRGEKHMYGGKG